VEPFTGAMVKVTMADWPAGMDAGEAALAVSVKSGVRTVTVTGEEVEGALIPLYFPTTEFVPTGSEVVVKEAVPPDAAPVPKAVVEPLL